MPAAAGRAEDFRPAVTVQVANGRLDVSREMIESGLPENLGSRVVHHDLLALYGGPDWLPRGSAPEDDQSREDPQDTDCQRPAEPGLQSRPHPLAGVRGWIEVRSAI